MILFKKIYFFFRKKRNEDSEYTKRYKTKRTKVKRSIAKRRFTSAKQKAKIFVPPSIQDAKIEGNSQVKQIPINARQKSTKPKQKTNKTKQRPSKTKQRLNKAKQPARIVVSPPLQNSTVENGSAHLKLKQPLSPPTTTSKRKVRIPSQVKLVITGSVGAGKTTAIASLAENEPITTEAKPTDEVALLKATTTTSMDYGTFHHSLKSKIHLYGTPGQKRFSFMGAILTEGASGLIVLINNNQKQPLNDLSFYLQHNEEFLQKNHAAIGITHFDVNKSHSITEYTDFMANLGMQWPVFPIDARKNSDVLMLVDLIIDATFRSQALEA